MTNTSPHDNQHRILRNDKPNPWNASKAQVTISLRQVGNKVEFLMSQTGGPASVVGLDRTTGHHYLVVHNDDGQDKEIQLTLDAALDWVWDDTEAPLETKRTHTTFGKQRYMFTYGTLDAGGQTKVVTLYAKAKNKNPPGQPGEDHEFSMNVKLKRALPVGMPDSWLAISIDPTIKNPPPDDGKFELLNPSDVSNISMLSA